MNEVWTCWYSHIMHFSLYRICTMMPPKFHFQILLGIFLLSAESVCYNLHFQNVLAFKTASLILQSCGICLAPFNSVGFSNISLWLSLNISQRFQNSVNSTDGLLCHFFKLSWILFTGHPSLHFLIFSNLISMTTSIPVNNKTKVFQYSLLKSFCSYM